MDVVRMKLWGVGVGAKRQNFSLAPPPTAPIAPGGIFIEGAKRKKIRIFLLPV